MNMQIRKVLVLVAAWLLFAGAWLSISSAIWVWLHAISIHRSFFQTLLDAKAGYFGLLAFGLSASGLLLLASCQKPEQSKRLFSVFRVTFYSSAVLLFPTILASLLYMIN